MKTADMIERDRNIIADFLMDGLTHGELAERYGITKSGISEVLRRRGVKLTNAERTRRNSERMRARQPLICGARAEGLWRARSQWPDCPPEYRDLYRLYRVKGYTVHVARALIEEKMA